LIDRAIVEERGRHSLGERGELVELTSSIFSSRRSG